jgi:drug/metabolite transporter (DMT)-like permease
MVLVVVLSLAAAAVYGASDFLGAFAARTINVIKSTTLNYLLGAIVIVVLLPIVGGQWSPVAVWSGSIAGVLALVGLVVFYAVLAIGPMSLLSPVIALVQSIVPVAIAATTGQGLSPLAWGAIVLAVVAILLLSPPRTTESQRISLRGAILAIVSGLLLGGSLIALDFAPKDSGLVPAFIEIVVGLAILLVIFAVLLVVRGRVRWLSVLDAGDGNETPTRRAWLAAAFGGVLLGVANSLIVIALHLGNLAVVAVLTALYPIGTVILAATFLKERMSRLQFVGIGLVIVASLILSVA